MYIKWNDTNVPTTDYRLNASPLLAFRKKEDAIASLKHLIESAKQIQCSLYKKYFFIEEMELL